MVVQRKQCCVGYLDITAFVIFNAGTNSSIGFDATVQVDTTTKCIDYYCEGRSMIGGGPWQRPPMGVVQLGTTCDKQIDKYNSEHGANEYPGGFVASPSSCGPVPPTFISINIKRAKKLGCCDFPCPDQHSSQVHFFSSRIPGDLSEFICPDPLYPGWGSGHSQEIELVFQQIMSKFGLDGRPADGGGSPPTFLPCCTKETVSVWQPGGGSGSSFGVSISPTVF